MSRYPALLRTVVTLVVAMAGSACAEPVCPEGQRRIGSKCLKLLRTDDAGASTGEPTGSVGADSAARSDTSTEEDAKSAPIPSSDDDASLGPSAQDANAGSDADGLESGAACLPAQEVCNGVDDDCDNMVDEETSEPPLGTACSSGGQGACAVSGKYVCSSGKIECNVAATPLPEICDGIDNDCDGTVDNVPGKGAACAVGAAECTVMGVMDCGPSGALACKATPKPPSAETCDGKDNDCDGAVDNVPGKGTPCTVGNSECASTGVMDCNASGSLACNATPKAPSAEICDGKDNDCDGIVDNVPGKGTTCTVGVGQCTAIGVKDCDAAGTLACNATPKAPSTEKFDGVDNDCDGQVDEGFSSATMYHMCGSDSDCTGDEYCESVLSVCTLRCTTAGEQSDCPTPRSGLLAYCLSHERGYNLCVATGCTSNAECGVGQKCSKSTTTVCVGCEGTELCPAGQSCRHNNPNSALFGWCG